MYTVINLYTIYFTTYLLATKCSSWFKLCSFKNCISINISFYKNIQCIFLFRKKNVVILHCNCNPIIRHKNSNWYVTTFSYMKYCMTSYLIKPDKNVYHIQQNKKASQKVLLLQKHNNYFISMTFFNSCLIQTWAILHEGTKPYIHTYYKSFNIIYTYCSCFTHVI